MLRIRRRAIHPRLTPALICAAVERAHASLDNPGFCILCGAEADGCEPDMRNGPCEACGARTVYGAAELLMMVA